MPPERPCPHWRARHGIGAGTRTLARLAPGHLFPTEHLCPDARWRLAYTRAGTPVAVNAGALSLHLCGDADTLADLTPRPPRARPLWRRLARRLARRLGLAPG